MCQSITLGSRGNTTISYCSKCRNHYIWQGAFILTFNSFQYDCFLEEINRKIGSEEFLGFPDGISRILLPTPVQEILFTFSEDEWRDFTTTLQEAYYMREVYQIIN